MVCLITPRVLMISFHNKSLIIEASLCHFIILEQNLSKEISPFVKFKLTSFGQKILLYLQNSEDIINCMICKQKFCIFNTRFAFKYVIMNI